MNALEELAAASTPPQPSLVELLRLAINDGGSGRGMSFWADASKCGKRAVYSEEQKAQWAADPASRPAFDTTKKNAYVTGSVYHKCHELWRTVGLDKYAYDYNEALSDTAVADGLALFSGWKNVWPRDFWGETVAVEHQLPEDDQQSSAIEQVIGTLVNGKPDLVVDVKDEHLPLVHTRAPNVTAGRWLVDFKTEANPYETEYYTQGPQALWYPLLWNVCYPNEPVKGIIFDLIKKFAWNAKVKTHDTTHFRAVVAERGPLDAGPEELLRGMIEQGLDNITQMRGNVSQCRQFEFGAVRTCHFLHNPCIGG